MKAYQDPDLPAIALIVSHAADAQTKKQGLTNKLRVAHKSHVLVEKQVQFSLGDNFSNPCLASYVRKCLSNSKIFSFFEKKLGRNSDFSQGNRGISESASAVTIEASEDIDHVLNDLSGKI